MHVVRILLELAIILVVGLFSYWAYVGYAGSPSSSPYWTEINANMPHAWRRYACDEISKRETGAVPSCENN